MKKILVLISLILCLSMVFAACNAKDVEDDNNDAGVEDRVDNVEANIAMLVKLLNTYENADQIYTQVMDMTKQETTIDLSKVAEELKKVEFQGSTHLAAFEDGEKLEEEVDFSIAIKDNNLHFEGMADGDQIGLDAYLTDSLQFVLAAWENYEGEIDIEEAFAIDINDIMDTYMEMMEESMSQVTETEMPIDLKEVVLGGIKAEDIEYKDGKYYLKKEAIYRSLMATVDSFIDAAADEGILPEGFDEQYDEIKGMVEKVVDAVELNIYFLIKYETIEGLGMNANVVIADLAEAMGEDPADAGDVEYIKAAFEVSINGESASVEFKQAGKVNKIDANIEFVTEGDKAIGINATYVMDVETVSKYTNMDSKYNEQTYEYEQFEVEVESVDVVKADMTSKLTFLYDGDAVCGFTTDLDVDFENKYKRTENGVVASETASKVDVEADVLADFSKFDDANATVLDVTFKMNDKYNTTSEWSTPYEDNVNFAFSVKTTDANKANVVIEAGNTRKELEEGKWETDTYSFKIEGTIAGTTKDVTVPAPNAAVKDAMDEAKANPMGIEDLMGGAKEEEAIPMPGPDYDYDDNYGDEYYPEYDEYVTVTPDYDYNW